MKLKNPPKEPVREYIKKSCDFGALENLSTLLEDIPTDVLYKDIFIEAKHEYDDTYLNIYWKEIESVESYNNRYNRYLEKKIEYEKWVLENKSYIESLELKKKEESKKLKEKRRLASEKASAERIIWLQKELEKELRGKNYGNSSDKTNG